MDDTVKVLKIDGTEASVANIKAGSYKISRPFNIVTKDKISEAAQDFINFILSSDGQAVVEENGYIPLDDTKAYKIFSLILARLLFQDQALSHQLWKN